MKSRYIILNCLLILLSCSDSQKNRPIFEDSYIFITNPLGKEMVVDYFTIYQYENKGLTQVEFKEKIMNKKFKLSENGYKNLIKLGYPYVFEINDYLNEKQVMDSINIITTGEVFRLHFISFQNRGQIIKYLFDYEKKHLKYFEKAGVHILYQNTEN